jgi:hypothetical protein
LGGWARETHLGLNGFCSKTSKVKLVSCCELPLQNLHPLTLPSSSLPYSLTMPKSKREKVVSLTKTGKKTRDDKSNQIEAVRPPLLLYKLSSCCCESTKFADPPPSTLRHDLQIKESASKWTYLWLFNVGDMRNSHLKEVRSQWRGSVSLPSPPHLRSRGSQDRQTGLLTTCGGYLWSIGGHV